MSIRRTFSLKRTHHQMIQSYINSNSQNFQKNELRLSTRKACEPKEYKLPQRISCSQFNQNKIDSKLDRKQSQFNYTDIIGQIIAIDEKLNEKENKFYHQSQTYFVIDSKRTSFGKIASIPKIVQQIYEKQYKKKNQVNFTQGYLPDSQNIYYAIENTLILFEWKTIFNNPDQYTKIIFNKTIIGVKQINLNYDENSKRQLLLISHPWVLSLYTYTQQSKKQICNLQANYSLHCQKVEHFEVIRNKVYYFDLNKRLRIISIQQQLPIFNSKIVYETINGYMKYFKIKKTSFLNFKINNFFSQILGYISPTSFYIFSQENILLKTIKNSQNQYIFVLWRVIPKLISIFCQYRSIGIYSIENQVLIRSISENQIYESISGFINLEKKQFKIYSIASISNHFSPKANINIILQNTIQIYLQITEKKIFFFKAVYPPKLQDSIYLSDNSLVSLCQRSQYSMACALNSFEHSLVICRKNNQIYSYFISKDYMNFIDWNWNCNRQLFDHYLYEAKEKQNENKYISSLLRASNFKDQYLLNITNSKSNIKSIHYGPTYYIYANDKSLSYIICFRQIDLLFTILIGSHNVQQQDQWIQQVFKQTSPIELQSLLIQIYVDRDGVYFVNEQFINKKALQNRKKNSFFINNHLKSQQGNKFYQEYHYNKISQKIFTKAKQIIQKYSEQKPDKNQKNFDLSIPNDNKTILNTIQVIKNQAIFLYYSRFIRIIWSLSITMIPKKVATYIGKRLNDILQFYNTMSSTSSLKSQKQIKIKYQLKKFLIKNIQIIHLIEQLQYLPQITFKNALQKDIKYYQKYLFKNINTSKQFVIKKWQDLFPLYITQSFIKTIYIYQQIQKLQSHQQILLALKSRKQYPLYFIQYLVKEKNINQAKQMLIEKDHHLGFEINVEKFNLNNIEGIKQSLEEVKNKTMNIRSRQVLLNYIQRQIKIKQNSLFEEYQQKSILNQINQLKICIKIQSNIIWYYQQSQTNQNIMHELIYQLYNRQQLLKFSQSLNSIQCQLICFTLISSPKGIIKDKILQICQLKQQKKQLLQKLKRIISKTFCKLQVEDIIYGLLTYSYKQLDYKRIIQQLLYADKKLISNKQLWIGKFLIDSGYSREKIYKSYLSLFRQSKFRKDCNNFSLFKWINWLIFVKEYYQEGKKQLINQSKQYPYQCTQTSNMIKVLLKDI